MYKKSITRIEKENESSQAELSNPALQDIIATNHVVLAKKPHEQRFSRACKAAVLMIVLGLIAIGIIVLTVVLAHSRNALMAVVSRSLDGNWSQTPNNTRLLLVDDKNLSTVVTDEPRENENWQKTTVTLTTYNLPSLTTASVHISSSMISTEQQDEYTTSRTSTMKSYPSTNTIANERTTTERASTQQPTTDALTSAPPTTVSLTEKEELAVTTQNQEYLFTSSDPPTTSTVDSTSPSIRQTTSPLPEDTSFTNFISRHFDLRASTVVASEAPRTTDFAEKVRSHVDEDMLDDLLFS